jgi:hypothetical protein
MLDIEFIAFACFPPKSETSHDGGIVGLLYLRHLSHLHSLLWLIVHLQFKEISLRRLRGHSMCFICRCLYRRVETQSVLCLILPQ